MFDVPVNYDNTAEYYDACDEDEEVELWFICDGCDQQKLEDNEQPYLVKDPTVDVLVFCKDCYEGPYY